MNIIPVVLAAGQGTRMMSDLPKVLHPLSGTPLISILLDTLETLSFSEVIAVTGFQADLVEEELAGRARCVLQAEQLGTGHAVMQASSILRDFDGYVLVLCGDVPLLRKETVEAFAQTIEEHAWDAGVVGIELEDPFGYGRLIQDEQGGVSRIVEEKCASDEEKKISLVNSGMICVRSQLLFDALQQINCENVAGEYYLTDVVELLYNQSKSVGVWTIPDADELMGINSPDDLKQAEMVYRQRKDRV